MSPFNAAAGGAARGGGGGGGSTPAGCVNILMGISAAHNLSSFCTSWAPQRAPRIINQCQSTNMLRLSINMPRPPSSKQPFCSLYKSPMSTIAKTLPKHS
eukprot:177963-Prorocentrum_minimum.AAC.1